MTPVGKTTLAFGVLCLATVLGTSLVPSKRAQVHYRRLIYAGRNAMPERVVEEYHYLPANYRDMDLVKAYYEEAKCRVGDYSRLNFFPTVEPADCIALGILGLGMVALWFLTVPSRQKLYVQDEPVVQPDTPTDGQLELIKRINNGIVPVGLTKSTAAVMIKNHLMRVSSMPKRQRIDISPSDIMSASSSYRERMRLERERKRAQEKLIRQQERARRQQEREAQRAQKAADRLYDKRVAEEEKLIKARDGSRDGVARRARSAKARAIQELQDLVNDILEDKKIEAQEVRQLKAWLLANKQAPEDFAQMLRIIDESLVDGIIDAEETQAIYEGVIDCLITLRERRS